MPLRKLIMKGEINMKYRRVITMLASASLAISIPVTSLAAEVNLVVPNKIGTSNHADTQGETDTTQEQEKVQTEPMMEEAQTETPSLEDSIPELPQPEIPDIVPQLPELSLEEVASTSPFEIDSNGVLTKYTGTDSVVIVPDNVTKISSRAFENNVSIEKIIINELCTNIANSAISNCQNLKEVVINSKNITFGTSSTCVLGTNNLKVTGYPYSEVPLYCDKFANLTFSPLEQPEEEKFTIDSNGTLVRYWGNDEVVIVPDGVKKIGTKAFLNNSTMKKLILPESCTEFNRGAITDCTMLTCVDIGSRELKLSFNWIVNPPERVEIHGYLYSQPYYYCDKYEYLVFVAKDSVNGGIQEVPASPEKFMDGTEQKDLYKITVRDIIHSYSDEKVIERNIYIPDLDRYCSPLAVNGSHFTFSANEDILAKRGHTLVSDKTVEGTVNGTDIVVTFHYAYEGNSINYTQKAVTTSYQGRVYCDMYVADQVGKPLSNEYTLHYSTSGTSGEVGRVAGDQYKYDASGTLTGVSSSNKSLILTLDKSYLKLQEIFGSSPIYQYVPSVFGKNGIEEQVILDTTQADPNEKYRLAYDVSDSIKEETFELRKGINNTIGSFTVKLKPVDGYLSTPTPEVEVSAGGLLNLWGLSATISSTDAFVINPVTNKTEESPYGALLTLKIDAVGIWEELLEDMKNKGSEALSVGLYCKNNGDIVFLPEEFKLVNRRFPNEPRLSNLQAVQGGDIVNVNTDGFGRVICIKNKKNFCMYDSVTGTWSGGHIPEAGELCKDSTGKVYVCEYPVGTAPDTWGYVEIPDNLLERLDKLIGYDGII